MSAVATNGKPAEIPLRTAILSRLELGRQTLAVRRKDQRMFEHSPRIEPDPSRGVFETLLVAEGEPVEMETHLRRLAQSLEALYSQTLPLQIEEKLRQAAAGIRLGRL